MPSQVSSGIVNVTDAVAHTNKLGSYITYTDRDEAIWMDHLDQQNSLSVDGYNYTSRIWKSPPAFSLTNKIIWRQRSVFSFRNDFLTKD